MLFCILATSNYRGWFSGINVGFANRNIDPKFNHEKLKKLLPPLDSSPGNLIDTFNQNFVFGLKNTFYVEALLGYHWRIKHWYVGVNCFFNYEPRTIDLAIPMDAERIEKSKMIIQLQMKHILAGGLETRIGYYVTPSTAIIGFVGLEFGKQGTVRYQNPMPPIEIEPVTSLPDFGLRLGLEAKIDISEKVNLRLGYHLSYANAKWAKLIGKDPLKDSLFDHLSLSKYRVYVGCYYQWNKKFA